MTRLYSECCGAEPKTWGEIEYEICPDCQEHCGFDEIDELEDCPECEGRECNECVIILAED